MNLLVHFLLYISPVAVLQTVFILESFNVGENKIIITTVESSKGILPKYLHDKGLVPHTC